MGLGTGYQLWKWWELGSWPKKSGSTTVNPPKMPRWYKVYIFSNNTLPKTNSKSSENGFVTRGSFPSLWGLLLVLGRVKLKKNWSHPDVHLCWWRFHHHQGPKPWTQHGGQDGVDGLGEPPGSMKSRKKSGGGGVNRGMTWGVGDFYHPFCCCIVLLKVGTLCFCCFCLRKRQVTPGEIGSRYGRCMMMYAYCGSLHDVTWHHGENAWRESVV